MCSFIFLDIQVMIYNGLLSAKIKTEFYTRDIHLGVFSELTEYENHKTK